MFLIVTFDYRAISCVLSLKLLRFVRKFRKFGGICIALLVNLRIAARLSADGGLRAVCLAKRIRRHIPARKRNHPGGFAFCERKHLRSASLQ